ncbi:MAG: SAM-dependent methyltransferase [Desulfobacterales bacterium]|nr:SAM-dependent methyltransferase [Desulfobacterales bacterium]
MSQLLLDSLKAFGATEDEILLFNASDYLSLNYLNLIASDVAPHLPEGVILSDGRPVMYFIDETNLALDAQQRLDQTQKAINVLACRGETAVLAVVSHGQLMVYPVNPGENIGEGLTVTKHDDYSSGFIRDLIEGALPTKAADHLYRKKAGNGVDDLLFSLLMNVGKDLNATNTLKGQHETILALVGRALLTRFLVDRDIITTDTFPELFSTCLADNCFSTPKSAALTNAWLDETFNGDLLPLPAFKNEYAVWFATLDADVFRKLSFIMGHTNEYGQRPLPGFINFAHVPVGLLSEVYERYAHENLEEHIRFSAKKESIHYTPRHIAEYMLSQSFDAVTTASPHLARVLDPSCGAGVFVVLAFRHLIAEHWKATGTQPDTYKIRDILYDQITGFDINKAALTLAALGLYLSALELDPEPLPTSKLKFKSNLIGSILHCVRGKDEPWSETPAIMGSLGESVSDDHLGKYDIVIGNPPWSSFPTEMGKKLSNVVRSVALKRDPERLAGIAKNHNNPDQVPDLPFIWKSMEWAKPGATIAFVLHARVLFKNSHVGIKAREDLLKALNVTGILNAADLRESNVWTRIKAQFCLLFAKNDMPTQYNYFHFISPKYEKELNEHQRRIRVDYQSAEPVQASAIEQRPYLLKTLSQGTALDVGVIDRITSFVINGQAIPLDQYWANSVGPERTGTGFQTSSTKEDASFLINMGAAILSKKDNADYIIDTSSLCPFDIPRLHRTRKKTIYEPPLVLINKAIAADKNTVSARISLDKRPIAFNESFYGYSTCGHPSAETLAKYLFAIFNSDLLLHYTLMTSSQYGIEREVVHKADVDSFPIIPLELLSDDQTSQIEHTFDSFKLRPTPDKLNQLVYSIYGLSEYDQQVIRDTLSVALPIASSIKRAQQGVSNSEIESFCTELLTTLDPYVVRSRTDDSRFHSWRFISISTNSTFDELRDKDTFVEMANNSGASRILIISENNLHIGMLNQYRYWTPSRARLLALQLLRDNCDFLEKK